MNVLQKIRSRLQEIGSQTGTSHLFENLDSVLGDVTKKKEDRVADTSLLKKEIKVICLDPGHGDNFSGGLDPGTNIKVGETTFLEKDIILPTALLLKDKLE
ncbi:MAG: hypothetical protein SFU27_12195 [Thermonemataceae bacterium]|nr:hypothetical protein [Thermonemataceae bacterium]